MQIQQTLNELNMLISILKATLLQKCFSFISLLLFVVLNVFRHKK